VIASARAVVAPGGVLRSARSQPPLTIRQVRADDPEVCAICLVGTAAGPLAGDRLRLEIVIEAAAQAHVTSAGAAIAQGRAGGPPSEVRTHAKVGAQARLVSRAEPLVVCAGSAVAVRVDIELAASAALVWRELVVLGRAGEDGGAVTLDWDVRRAGRPLLRQSTDLSAEPPWTGLLGGRRVLASELHVGPDVDAATLVRSPSAVVQRVADGCQLRTVLADDVATALAELDALADLVAAGGPILSGARGE
jgi:urease accessory protein